MPVSSSKQPEISDFDRGVVIGILVGEGHFGGDGKQPHITLRMHTRHESLFLWLQGVFPRSRLYGPYNHGGRSYYQWMVRGQALVEDVLPLIERSLTDEIDSYAASRVREMRDHYADFFARHER
jgi:hypothetical protein